MTKMIPKFVIRHRALSAVSSLVLFITATGVWCAFGHQDQQELPIRWYTDIDQARKVASDLGKPVLMDVYATWCGPCQRMKATTLADPSLEKGLKSYVCVSIDIDNNPDLANRLDITSIPAFFVIDPATGRVLKENREGAVSVAEFQAWLASPLPGGT